MHDEAGDTPPRISIGLVLLKDSIFLILAGFSLVAIVFPAALGVGLAVAGVEEMPRALMPSVIALPGAVIFGLAAWLYALRRRAHVARCIVIEASVHVSRFLAKRSVNYVYVVDGATWHASQDYSPGVGMRRLQLHDGDIIDVLIDPLKPGLPIELAEVVRRQAGRG